MKKLIGTHNSATGEHSKNIWSSLVTIFSRTQTKTLVQQYKAGCRLFDLRIRFDELNKPYFCHGLWKSNKDVYEALRELNSANDTCYVGITYEGKPKNIMGEYTEEAFATWAENLFLTYRNLKPAYISIKKPVWKDLYSNPEIRFKQGFKSLDGTSWHTLIPIPWLWDVLLSRPHKFNTEYYTLVDFL